MSEQTNYRQLQVRSASCRPPDYYNLLVNTLEKLKPRLIRFVSRLLRDKEAAHELYTELCIRVIRAGQLDKIESYGELNLFKWIHKIARRLAYDNNRYSKLRRHGELSDLLVADVNLVDMVIADEMNEILNKAVEYLPDVYRLTIVLCHYEELSYEEAANVLGLSEGGFKTRLHRARSLLRQKLEEHGYGELCQDRSLRHRQATKDSVTTPSTPLQTDH